MIIRYLGHSAFAPEHDGKTILGADTVIPCHYDTFPPIETDAQAFKADVGQAGIAQVVVLAPGEEHSP